MDTNLIVTLIGLAITLIAGVGGLIISLFSKISKLEGRLDTLANDNRLQDKVDKIHDESIQKLQQRATELHESTQAQLDHLATDIAQQQTQVSASLQVLKAQEASSLVVLTERAQPLVQQFQKIEERIQQLRNTTEAESASLTAEIAQQWARVKQKIEQEVEMLRQEKVSTRLAGLEVQFKKWLWWLQLSEQWQVIFRKAIGIESELTKEDELLKVLSLTELNCREKNLTSLEPLRNLTQLQTLDCRQNRLTNLEPLQNLTHLQTLNCERNPLTSLEPLRNLTLLQTLNCESNQLTSLEPLRNLTQLQTLNCGRNRLTSLEPLHGLKNLMWLFCGGNSSGLDSSGVLLSLGSQELERFKKAVPSCKVDH